jgi:uncharacterized protein YciW
LCSSCSRARPYSRRCADVGSTSPHRNARDRSELYPSMPTASVSRHTRSPDSTVFVEHSWKYGKVRAPLWNRRLTINSPSRAMRLRWNTAQISASVAPGTIACSISAIDASARRIASRMNSISIGNLRARAGTSTPVGVGEGQPLRPERVDGLERQPVDPDQLDRGIGVTHHGSDRVGEATRRAVDVVVGRHHVEALGQLHPVDGGQADRQVLAPAVLEQHGRARLHQHQVARRHPRGEVLHVGRTRGVADAHRVEQDQRRQAATSHLRAQVFQPGDVQLAPHRRSEVGIAHLGASPVSPGRGIAAQSPRAAVA